VYDWVEIVGVCAEGQTGRRFMTELGQQFWRLVLLTIQKNLSARMSSKTHDSDN